ncbi:MAG: hypothetical protein RL131_1082 [Bacteroidota bacterium]
MNPEISQIIFSILFILAIFLFIKRMLLVRKIILLGKPFSPENSKKDRIKNLLLIAFGQKKMFKKPTVAFLHLLVYAGFIIINIELLEIVLDGILGTHRLFYSFAPNTYLFLINAFEVLALGVIIACVVFLIRRNFISIPRLSSNDLKGWPNRDAHIILFAEIVLMLLFLKMNAADSLLQQRNVSPYQEAATGDFMISSLLHILMNSFSTSLLIATERTTWWMHILGILAFMNYLSRSKHLHIILAFPNSYFNSTRSSSTLQNMPAIQKEVYLSMNPGVVDTSSPETPSAFGAQDIQDLSWKNILDAYSCTECGRCSNACPATLTGKKLSPRKIMMATRDRAEEIGRTLSKNQPTESTSKTLLHDYISEEELRACTTCQACIEECPIGIRPMDIIVELRRYLVMEKSIAPAAWTSMFSNTESNFAPWKFSPDQREDWNNK